MWIFLHIPKTAGVAVREILSAKHHKNEVVHVEDPNRFILDIDAQNTTKLIHGHFDISFIERRPCIGDKVFTFLRDPFERSISEYFFVKKGSYDFSSLPPEQADVIKRIQSLSLDEYLLSQERGIRGRVQNNQLFFLSGDVFNASHSLEQRYEMACQNLDKFHYIGIVEDMEKSLQLLAYKTNSAPQNPVIRNSTQRTNYDVAQATKNEFLNRNKFEYMIYEYARQKMLSSYENAFREMLRERFIKDLEQSPEQSELYYTFDQPLAGDGWHTREENSEVQWRFTGPSATANIYFGKIAPREKTISLTIFHAITPSHIDSMSIIYNGEKLKSPARLENVLTYEIPEHAITNKTHTHIEISSIAPCKPAELDNRLLGIAFSAITIR
ncbi:sulfotransferase family protein [Pseudomonas sp. J452]|uniref:sulfotransferase family protein n=1 Tax=Pseudomonas sp. J452 TaxID=2898441 RepID=UPI0021AE2D6C|nr:sulfotransferase family protein [Pseudomonas sp. J452]UUY09841.1 sulfotransferase family protein [Pseudomonas sp. J452]